MSKISILVQFAKNDTTNSYKEINFSSVPNFQAKIILEETGIDVKGCIKYLTASGIRHVLNSHADEHLEAYNNQIAVTDEEFEIIPIVLSSPDFYEVGNNNRRRNKAILFKKIINNKIYHVIMSIVNKSGENILMFNTMYIKKADEINHQP
ncbi:MAG: hypothetical protein Q8K64_09185 [Sediminibacterium sp.]|nr:MAG: hypothetical protein FD183_215 [Chitinophagaceae bacterium]MDP1843579.1 hypothetical protein [Sediminibacterium sp.]